MRRERGVQRFAQRLHDRRQRIREVLILADAETVALPLTTREQGARDPRRGSRAVRFGRRQQARKRRDAVGIERIADRAPGRVGDALFSESGSARASRAFRIVLARRCARDR